MTQPSSPRDSDPGHERLRGRLMQQSLSALLDRVRGSRDVLPHLAALEGALGERGLAAIAAIAPQHLTRICSQLSSLPLPEGDQPLQDLQERLLQALQASRRPKAEPAFDAERTVVIREISHSEFMAVAAEQGGAPR
ncbi:MAG: hypothetical protein KF683_15140 [Rubrivivax sp.]|nr:hypothetical protein [Rubrivivax sp.]